VATAELHTALADLDFQLAAGVPGRSGSTTTGKLIIPPLTAEDVPTEPRRCATRPPRSLAWVVSRSAAPYSRSERGQGLAVGLGVGRRAGVVSKCTVTVNPRIVAWKVISDQNDVVMAVARLVKRRSVVTPVRMWFMT
jgi:hypothetical protein